MFEEYQYHMAANSVIKCGRAHPDLPAVICIHSQWFTAVFPSENEPVCVCYGSIASAFAVLLIANGRESVGVRESASNLRGLCVRGSLWPDVNIMDSAMWDKRCWLITSPGRCPFLFSSRLSASVFSRVSLYKAAVIIPSVADGEVRAGDLSIWDGHALITRHRCWQASAAHHR